MINRFKIPRKLKKKLKKTMWLYHKKNNGYLMASPATNKEDFNAYKRGELIDVLENTRSRKRRKEYNEWINKEIYIDDETLKIYVDDIFSEQYRYNSLEALLKVKEMNDLKKYYFQFINSYNKYKDGEDSFSNTCCMIIDSIKKDLKEKEKKK